MGPPDTLKRVRLFHRDSGSVALTPIGHSLLSHAEKVRLATEEFSQQSIRSDHQIGILRLGVTELIAQTWLRSYLIALREVFPNVDVELKVDLTVSRTRNWCRGRWIFAC